MFHPATPEAFWAGVILILAAGQGFGRAARSPWIRALDIFLASIGGALMCFGFFGGGAACFPQRIESAAGYVCISLFGISPHG